MDFLRVSDISKDFGGVVLFDGVTFRIVSGQKIALVADNGAGKSTLLSIIEGRTECVQGSIARSKECIVRFLHQDPQRDQDMDVHTLLYQYDDPVGELMERYHRLAADPLPDESVLASLLHDIDSVDGRGHQARIDEVVTTRHLSALLGKNLSTLSGGEKKRVGLAKLFLGNPDVVVLDEPTNHLDLPTIELLENFLTQTDVTVLMVTHDRYFLERVCTDIYELTNRKIHCYDGNYQYFLEKKAERAVMDEIAFHKLTQRHKAERERVAKSPRARESKSRKREEEFDVLHQELSIKKYERRQKRMDLTIDVYEQRLGDKIMKISKLCKTFDTGLCVLDMFSHEFRQGERVGIIGPNGVGKSTFVDMLVGDVVPDSGVVVIAPTVTVGYYRQQDGIPHLDLSIIEYVQSKAEFAILGDGTRLSLQKMLERFLFSPLKQQTFLSGLSGGEKKRLQLMMTLLPNPNFLILDEPTNDFDLSTIGVIESFLSSYRGCLVVISHDRFFMDSLVDHLFVFEGEGRIRDFYGNYSMYRDDLSSRNASKKNSAKVKDSEKEGSLTDVIETIDHSGVQSASDFSHEEIIFDYTHHRQMQRLAKKIDTLSLRRDEINGLFHTPDLSHERIKELGMEVKVLAQQIEQMEDEWFGLATLQEQSKKS